MTENFTEFVEKIKSLFLSTVGYFVKNYDFVLICVLLAFFSIVRDVYILLNGWLGLLALCCSVIIIGLASFVWLSNKKSMKFTKLLLLFISFLFSMRLVLLCYYPLEIPFLYIEISKEKIDNQVIKNTNLRYATFINSELTNVTFENCDAYGMLVKDDCKVENVYIKNCKNVTKSLIHKSIVIQ